MPVSGELQPYAPRIKTMANAAGTRALHFIDSLFKKKITETICSIGPFDGPLVGFFTKFFRIAEKAAVCGVFEASLFAVSSEETATSGIKKVLSKRACVWRAVKLRFGCV